MTTKSIQQLIEERARLSELNRIYNAPTEKSLERDRRIKEIDAEIERLRKTA